METMTYVGNITVGLSNNDTSLKRVFDPTAQFKPSYHYTTCVISVLVMLTNGFVLQLFWMNRALYNKPWNRPLLSLAVTDFLTGINTLLHLIPFFQLHFANSMDGFSINYLLPLSCFTMFLSLVSIYHLCLLATDRCIAIYKPFQYVSIVTKTFMDRAIVAIWIGGFCKTMLDLTYNTGLLRHISSRYDNQASRRVETAINAISVILFAFLPSIVLATIYLKLFLTTRQLIRKDSNLQAKRRKEAKQLIIYFIMYVCFAMLCLPYFIVHFILYIDEKMNILRSAPVELFEALYMLRTLVSLVNPIIYTLLKRDVIGAAGKLIAALWGKQYKQCDQGTRGSYKEEVNHSGSPLQQERDTLTHVVSSV